MLLFSRQASFPRTHLLIVPMCILLLCKTTNSHAVIEQSLILPISFEYESNPSFSVTNEQEINRLIFVPSYSLTVNRETEQWNADLSFRIERSPDQTISQDRNDPLLNLGWKHDYETGQFSATAILNDQSTRISEFTDDGPVEFTNSSLETGDNTQKRRSLFLGWQKNVSDRTIFILNGEITNMAFEGPSALDLVGYRNDSLNASLNFPLSGRVETFTQLYASRYNPEGTNNSSSESRGFNIGVKWHGNENFNITASAGPNETISNGQIQSIHKSWQAIMSMQYSTLKTNSYFSASRSRSPGSTGNINEQNRIVAGWKYVVNERDNVALDFTWGQNLTLNKIETKSLIAKYTKNISIAMDFSLSAIHRNREDTLTKSYSNSVMASIIYNIPDF